MSSPFFIYGLIDPRSGELRYVGQTTHSLAQRVKEHLWHARRGDGEHVYRWMRKLLSAGFEPEVFELESCDSKHEMDESERFHIAYLRSIGCRLTNLTAGGDGRVGPCTEEHKRKVGDANRGRRRSAQARARMSVGQKARKVPANLGRVWSAEYRAKMTKARDGRRLVDEAGVFYESANDAARRLGLHVGSVSRAAKTGGTTGGHTLRYAE